MFKKDDKVICIEPDVFEILKLNHEYIITELDGTHVRVQGLGNWFNQTRFKLTSHKETKTCSCTIVQLMQNGCSCGAIKRNI